MCFYVNQVLVGQSKQELNSSIVARIEKGTKIIPVVIDSCDVPEALKTTVWQTIPMVTGVSFDFHNLTISWVSESSQWWQSMAVVVVFGLMVATFLTLVVVPSLYAFLGRFTPATPQK